MCCFIRSEVHRISDKDTFRHRVTLAFRIIPQRPMGFSIALSAHCHMYPEISSIKMAHPPPPWRPGVALDYWIRCSLHTVVVHQRIRLWCVFRALLGFLRMRRLLPCHVFVPGCLFLDVLILPNAPARSSGCCLMSGAFHSCMSGIIVTPGSALSISIRMRFLPALLRLASYCLRIRPSFRQ